MRLTLILCALFIHLTQLTAFSAGHLLAELPIVRGVVEIKIQGKEELQRVERGIELRIGSEVITADNSLAQLELPGNAFVNIGEDSRLRINHYSFNSDTYKRKIILRQLSGALRYIVPGSTSEGSSLMVETDSAVVSARAADFLLKVFDDKTELFVIDGLVSIKNSSPLVVGELTLKAFQSTVVASGEAPISSRNFFMKELIELKALTNVYGDFIEE
jgi:hypothetical protein